jgi:hypothetical protein
MLVPERVDLRTGDRGHREWRQRQCSSDARREQAALYGTTIGEHDGLVNDHAVAVLRERGRVRRSLHTGLPRGLDAAETAAGARG